MNWNNDSLELQYAQARMPIGACDPMLCRFWFSRPAPSTRPSHGMPSSHANSLFFFATSLSMRAVAAAAPTLGNPGGTGGPRVGITCTYATQP